MYLSRLKFKNFDFYVKLKNIKMRRNMSSGAKNGVRGLNIGVCNLRIWIFHEKLENIKNEDRGVIGYKNWVRGLNLHRGL